MRTAKEFKTELLSVARTPEPGYGGNVLPAAKMFSSLASHSEMLEFELAIQSLLESSDLEHRKWAVNLCLGFITFRDAIAWPKYDKGE
jgi:hypothetical protein